MRISKATFLLFLIIIPFVTQAQQETAVWLLGSGQQVSFQSGVFELKDFDGIAAAKASICDKEGNLLLYSDGRKVWNKNHEILSNGGALINDDAYISNAPIFIPYPNKDGWYILLYEEEYYGIIGGKYQNSLYYAEINTNALGGKGEVVKQKIQIHDNYHSAPTVSGYCNNNYYWLVIDRNDNTAPGLNSDRIYFYRIDRNGVNLEPKINDNLDIGNSFGYKFSPNGDKLFFRISGNSDDKSVVADFNFNTGELYNYRLLDLKFNYRKEFSSDSRFLYFFSDANLIQLDVRYSNILQVQSTAKNILHLPSNDNVIYPGQDLQIASDGKIYFYYHDILDNMDNMGKIGRINYPNKKGDSCNVELDIEKVESSFSHFPEFVTSFFRENPTQEIDKVFPDAGPDIELCSRSSVMLGKNESSNAFFQWFPDTDLSGPFSAQTIFNAPNLYYSPKTESFVLRASDANCWVNFDTIDVTINPIPQKLPIDGSWSVCPFVEEVEYWTESRNYPVKWLVEGGEIVSNPNDKKVRINWGETNSNASASVFATNNYGCYSDTSVFPVRINVELITETPKGPDKICIAKAKSVSYEIRNTNGSEYTWFPEGGKIISGQGTNKVLVFWQTVGQNSLAVKEVSVTIDTICYGESEPLFIDVINDSLEIELTHASYNTENNIELEYLTKGLNNDAHELYQIIENEWGTVQSEIRDFRLFNGISVYDDKTTGLIPQIFRLKVINACDEIFYSNPQQTIILEAREQTNSIRLNWNLNEFWELDQLKHEIWHSIDGINRWELIGTVDAQTEFDYAFGTVSLLHFFRVKEINGDKNLESWSNTIKIEVDDALLIPDVFTPNNDGFNDVWEIKNINFHPLKSATVYNKFGLLIYQCKNEYIPWNGKNNEQVLQGTYFYQFLFESGETRYGQVTILQ